MSFLISQSCLKDIWNPFQNILNADEWLIKHEVNISVIITFDLHMLK